MRQRGCPDAGRTGSRFRRSQRKCTASIFPLQSLEQSLKAIAGKEGRTVYVRAEPAPLAMRVNSQAAALNGAYTVDQAIDALLRRSGGRRLRVIRAARSALAHISGWPEAGNPRYGGQMQNIMGREFPPSISHRRDPDLCES